MAAGGLGAKQDTCPQCSNVGNICEEAPCLFVSCVRRQNKVNGRQCHFDFS